MRGCGAVNLGDVGAQPARDSVAAFMLAAISAAEEAADGQGFEAAVALTTDWLNATVCVGLNILAEPQGPSVHVTYGRTTDAWRTIYCEPGYLHRDLLVVHAVRSLAPVSWDDLQESESAAVSRSRMAAAAAGIGDSIIVPQTRAPAAAAAVLLAGPTLRIQTPADRHATAAIAAALHRAAARLSLGGGRGAGDASRLSRRESEVLYWVATERSDKAIAQVMRLSPETVMGYLRSAQRKLSTNGRLVAARRAADLGLLPLWAPGGPDVSSATDT